MRLAMTFRCRPALFALALALPALVTAAPPAVAQQSQDIGTTMEREYGVISSNSPEGRRLNEQLDRTVWRITDGMRRSTGKDFRIRSARILGGRSEKHDREVNAFALPDGRIYVTHGLIRLIQNDARAEDELAFVVAHEITHVTERHSAEQNRRALPVQILAAILGSATKSPALGQAAQLGAAAYASKFSRKDEYRADRGGLLAMEAAGYDPRGAIRMLQRLKETGGSRNSLLNGWFGSHPMTGNRIERVKEMIKDLDRGGRIPDRSERELEQDDRRR
jgi:predicted Zn-dependent protease